MAATTVAGLGVGQWVTGGDLLGGKGEAWHWDKPAVVEGRTIHLTFDGGSCDEKRSIEVEESDTHVTLTLRERERAGSCGGVGLSRLRRDVHLDKPLGHRTLIDGACQGGAEPLRGNCPDPVRRGTCGTADYRVDMPIEDDGRARLRVRVAHASPVQRWRLRWTFADLDPQRSIVTTDDHGRLVATHEMGRLPEQRTELREVELAPPGGPRCLVRGHLPMSYGS